MQKKIKFISAASSGCHWCPADSRISLRTCYVYRSANQWTLKVPLHTRYTSYKVGNGSYPTSVYEGDNVFLPLPMQLEIHGKHEKVLQKNDGTFVVYHATRHRTREHPPTHPNIIRNSNERRRSPRGSLSSSGRRATPTTRQVQSGDDDGRSSLPHPYSAAPALPFSALACSPPCCSERHSLARRARASRSSGPGGRRLGR